MEKRQTQEELHASVLEQLERMRELAKTPQVVRTYTFELPTSPQTNFVVRYSMGGDDYQVHERYALCKEHMDDIRKELEKTYPADNIFLIELD